jgi:glycosyltransferase involved in cell wall biosynthesis
MRLGIVGGIFGKPDEYRTTVESTPETVLADELERRGHQVVRLAHDSQLDLRDLDAVHVHHLAYGALAAATDSSTTPFIFTPHYFRYASRLRRVSARYVVRRADAVVSLSAVEAGWQRTAYGLAPQRQAVIPNGISETVFTYSPAAAPSNARWRLIYVGQLVAWKGVDVLLRALATVARDHPVELDLVYQVDTEEPALRRLAGELGLDRVRFLGVRSPKELSELYAASHLLVLPSRHGEALPSVISEAMFVGRPVVASDVAGVREQLAGFGVVVPPGDTEQLARGISGVLEGYADHVRRAPEMSQSARKRYSIAAMVDGHERLYESLSTRPQRTARSATPRRFGTTLGRWGVGWLPTGARQAQSPTRA